MVKGMIKFEGLKNITYLLYCICNTVAYLGVLVPIFYIKDMAEEKKMVSEIEATSLVSIIGTY